MLSKSILLEFQLWLLLIPTPYKAFQLGMYGANYVWMIPGYFAEDWQSVKQDGVSCSEEELQIASDGSIGLTTLSQGISQEVGRCGKVVKTVNMYIVLIITVF